MLLLSASELGQLLAPPLAVSELERAFAAFSSGRTVVPARSLLRLPPPISGLVLLMPAAVPDAAALGVKVVSVYGDNTARGLPTVTGSYLLLEYETGRPLALMDGAALTAIRTAAVTGLATKYLAAPGSQHLGVYGTGVQAASHVMIMSALFPFQTILICGRTVERARVFVQVHAVRAPDSRLAAVADADDLAQSADVLVTATTSARPLFDGRRLRPGTHINAIGAHTPEAREVDDETVRRSRIVAETIDGVLAEAGDVLNPMLRGVIDRSAIAAELGEVIVGCRPGRQSPDEITLFKSVGSAFEDAALARLAHQRALAQGIGTQWGDQ